MKFRRVLIVSLSFLVITIFGCSDNDDHSQGSGDAGNGDNQIHGVMVMEGLTTNEVHSGEGLYSFTAAFYESESDLEQYRFQAPDIEAGACVATDTVPGPEVQIPQGDNAIDVGSRVLLRLPTNRNYVIQLDRGANNVYRGDVEATIIPDDQVWDVEVPGLTPSEDRVWEGAFFAPKLQVPSVHANNGEWAVSWNEGNDSGDLYIEADNLLCSVEDTGLFLLPSGALEPPTASLIRVVEMTSAHPLHGSILTVGLVKGLWVGL
jgi:hypothetical protein